MKKGKAIRSLALELIPVSPQVVLVTNSAEACHYLPSGPQLTFQPQTTTCSIAQSRYTKAERPKVITWDLLIIIIIIIITHLYR